MRNGLERRIAAVYAARREKAERACAERTREVHASYPEIAGFDRVVADAGASMLSATLLPEKEASARLEALAAARRLAALLRGERRREG